jgi:DNA-binding PadR family transcriptional regulator
MGRKHLTDTQALVLAILQDGRRLHGLDIMQEAETKTQRALSGTLYRALHQLESAGLVDAEWERRGEGGLVHKGPPRRYYWLTGQGVQALAAYAAQLDWRATMLRPHGLVPNE